MNNHVYVVLVIPTNGNQPFIYGVFNIEDDAYDHYQTHGDLDHKYSVTKQDVWAGETK